MKLHLTTALLALLMLNTLNAFSQGKIMIVGGGTENYNDWSDIPYTWAVDNSANKRVAIVGFSSASNWLPGYFLSLGAVAAKNFTINSTTIADSQATYDSLMAYDVIFFRGGNQANYYLTYKHTKTQEALTDKFNSGGVIAGTSAGLHILSGVVFTAENGTAYSDDCLKNIFHNRITLKNDFLDIMPGYIFDSHFVERGRMARLLAFMARWKNDHDEDLTGIGVDDMTAFCIDASDTANITGYAFGTAAVNIYQGGETGHRNNKLFAGNVKVTQLLHNCSINLNTFDVEGFNSQLEIINTEENGNYTLLLSGSDIVNENNEFIAYLADSLGSASDPILIVTGTSAFPASAWAQSFTSAGAGEVNIGHAIPVNQSDPDFLSLIEQAKKIVFVGNSYQGLYNFIFLGGDNGQALHEKITSPGAIVAFIGDNSRFAGAVSVSDNYIFSAGASFYGNLTFGPGLNLLSTMVIMPNTYLYSTDYYENTNSVLPYAMLEEQVYRGVWLTVRNFLKYYVEDEKSYITVYGESPGLVLTSEGEAYDLNAKLFRNRQVGGFEKKDFSTLLYPDRMMTGDIAQSAGYHKPAIPIKAYFDPVSKKVIVRSDANAGKIHELAIYNTNGQLLNKEFFTDQSGLNIYSLNAANLHNGIYLLKIRTANALISHKLMIMH